MSILVRRLMLLILVVAALVGICAAPAFAATEPTESPITYGLSSSQYSVPSDPLKLKTYNANCGNGFHIGFETQYVGHISTKVQVATVTATETDHAKGDIYVLGTKLADQVGSYPDGTPYYSTVDVTLGNHSWTTDHTGTFSWSCVQNPSA